MGVNRQLMVTEREFIQRLALITGHGKDVVRDVIKAQAEFVIDELKNGIPVRIGPLGEFTTVTGMRQGGYDFSTKQMKPMKKTTRVKFKISSKLKEAVRDAESTE